VIHKPSDHMGARKVFVNGNEIDGVIYADTIKGVVEFCPMPLRIHKTKKDCVYTRKLRGKVEVEFA
jgi:hypothetical protein